jgi:hypothetical protein
MAKKKKERNNNKFCTIFVDCALLSWLDLFCGEVEFDELEWVVED